MSRRIFFFFFLFLPHGSCSCLALFTLGIRRHKRLQHVAPAGPSLSGEGKSYSLFLACRSHNPFLEIMYLELLIHCIINTNYSQIFFIRFQQCKYLEHQEKICDKPTCVLPIKGTILLWGYFYNILIQSQPTPLGHPRRFISNGFSWKFLSLTSCTQISSRYPSPHQSMSVGKKWVFDYQSVKSNQNHPIFLIPCGGSRLQTQHILVLGEDLSYGEQINKQRHNSTPHKKGEAVLEVVNFILDVIKIISLKEVKYGIVFVILIPIWLRNQRCGFSKCV